MSWMAALAGIATSLLNNEARNQAQKGGEQRYKQAYGAQAGSNQLAAAYRAQATRQAQLGLGDIREGYGNAITAINGVGAEQSRAIADQTALGVSAARAGSFNRGLFNSTSGAGLETQARYQGQRAQASLAERLAALRASYQANQGTALANQRGNVANALSGQALGQQQGTRALTEILGSREDTFDTSIYGQLGQLLAIYGNSFGGGEQTASRPGGSPTPTTTNPSVQAYRNAYGAPGSGQPNIYG